MLEALSLLGNALAALGVGVVVGVAVFVIATYAHLYAATGELRRILRALPREFLAELCSVVLWPWFVLAGGRYEPSCSRPDCRPIVLLHGYGMNRMSFFWLGRALARRGLGPLIGTSYVSLRSVRSSAQRLAGFIERTCAAEGVPKVDLVCHSLGGLLARYYAERLGGARHIHHIVTIGTPHQGTVAGHAALGRSALDLRPRSQLLDELATGPRPEGVVLTSIYSRADNIVVPPGNARLHGAGDEVEFGDLGHMALLLSPRVADAVAARLSDSTVVERARGPAPAAETAPAEPAPAVSTRTL